MRRLDGFDVVIVDDLGYVQQDRDEMEVLFTFLSARYERRSVMITSNLVFSQWDGIFKDPMTTAAAIDRVVPEGSPHLVRGLLGSDFDLMCRSMCGGVVRAISCENRSTGSLSGAC